MLSDHFSLTHFPFVDSADLNGLFQSPSFEATYEELLMGVLDGRNMQLLVGPGGVGRTTMLSRLRSALHATDLSVIKVSFTHFNLEEFITLLNTELADLPGARASLPIAPPPDGSSDDTGEPSEPEPGFPEQDSPRTLLHRQLEALRDAGIPLVLLIDDAEQLGATILNELPELMNPISREWPAQDPIHAGETNRAAAGGLAQVVLAVQPEFAQRLTGIELDTLNAAIDGILHLAAWDRTTVTDYVCAAIESASGMPGEIFTEEALEAISRHSDGIPTRVNKLCGGAMREAETMGKRRIGPEHVEGALSGLVPAAADAPHFSAGLPPPTDSNPAALDALGTFAMDEKERAMPKRTGLALVARLAPKVRILGRFAERGTWRAADFFGRARNKLRTSTISTISAISGMLPRRPASPENPRRRPPVALIGGASIVLVAAAAGALYLLSPSHLPESDALSDSELEPTNVLAAARASRPGPAATAVNRPGADLFQARQIEKLTDAVSSLSRTLVSFEARLRSFESDLGGVKRTVRELRDGPRPILAKASAPDARTAPAAAPPATWASGADAFATTRPASTPAVNTVLAKESAIDPKSEPKTVKNAIASMASTKSAAYVVQRGDTLWDIAKREGTSVKSLAGLNGLASDARLKAGQTLLVQQTSENLLYTVRKGDSLYSIGKRFEIAPRSLVSWNCLGKEGRIFPGQRINVTEPTGSDCNVKRG